MESLYRLNYNKFSDKQIVEKILAEPHDEEAAVYLLYERYKNALLAIYFLYASTTMWYNDCVNDLFVLLKGEDLHWQPLASFEWRSSFATWIKKIASREFPKTIKKMKRVIECGTNIVSINNDESEKPKVQIPCDGEECIERRLRKVMLMEAIGRLKDDDQRFVILKRLEGYKSKDIAIMLQERWKKYGIKKYNDKQKLVVPDADYVNVRTQRAKESLKKMIVEQ